MHKGEIKILCLLPVLGQPRISKRIKMLQEQGFYVEAGSFIRKYHKGRLPDCKVVELGEIEHGKFVSRLFRMLKTLPKIRKIGKSYDLIYCFGIDITLICVLASFGLGKKKITEIGDIRGAQVANGFKGKLVRILDKFAINSSDLLITTSRKYVHEYYNGWLGIYPNSLTLENKLEKNYVNNEGFEKVKDDSSNTVITIGYFGLLRCEKTLTVLQKLVSLYPNEFNLFLAGYPVEKNHAFSSLTAHESVTYFGEYKNPKDLSEIYSKVDLVWAAYPFPKPQEHNWKWARTNRFYESCFFGKPMIVLADSGDSSEVLNYNIGMTIENEEVELICKSILDASIPKLKEWKENVSKVPKETYLYTNENQLLEQHIYGLMEH